MYIENAGLSPSHAEIKRGAQTPRSTSKNPSARDVTVALAPWTPCVVIFIAWLLDRAGIEKVLGPTSFTF